MYGPGQRSLHSRKRLEINFNDTKILTDDNVDDILFIHRINLFCKSFFFIHLSFKRRQFPIKLPLFKN